MKRASPRWALILITALFALPLVLALLLFEHKLPFSTGEPVNRGMLVEPVVPIDWNLLSPANAPNASLDTEGHWVILYILPESCGHSCMIAIADLSRVHRATGRHRDRVKILLLVEQARSESSQQALQDLRSEIELGIAGSADAMGSVNTARINSGSHADCFLVDPLGRIMMAYNAPLDVADLSKDLKRLLTWSKLDKGR